MNRNPCSEKAGDVAGARAPDVSVVVIGRNEGRRLERCLASVQAAYWGWLRHEVVYVDSHSSDGSPAVAARLGARVYGLGDAPPCAAAGRNIGWRAARAPLVLFLDGDTLLEPGFVQQAWPTLLDPAVVAVWGHRRESAPAQSIYTRVLDLDWVFAPGRVDYFGGDALVRRAALEAVGGFDDALVAGEEPELCRRLRERGGAIEHLDTPMTRHDLAVTTLRAWWTRAERAGLAYAQVAARYAGSADPLWQREARRNRVHGTALLLAPLATAAAFWAHPLAGAGLLLAGLALWARSARRCRWKCADDPVLSWLYAAHSHLQQLPILAGQWRWWRLQRARRAPTLIEYKGLPARETVR
jgi:cellulose synthase/poly-beta-1,6-N-acetylglucosamine synthase-like glycosyltransferase